MEPETPAQGILKRNDWGDSMCYRVECECGSTEHGHEVQVEADQDGITVSIYVDAYTSYHHSFWDSMRSRLSIAARALFRGTVKVQAELMLREQQAVNYGHTLLNAVEAVKQFKQAPAKPEMPENTTVQEAEVP